MTRATLFPALLLLAVAGCSERSRAVHATRAWVRLPAVPGAAAAGYLTLTGARVPKRLVKAESALAQRVELHESMGGMGGMGGMGAGMTGMKPLAGVEVPARATVAFAPAGRHLMLFGLDPVVKPGTAVPIRLGFADGTTAEAEAKTVAAGDPAPY